MFHQEASVEIIKIINISDYFFILIKSIDIAIDIILLTNTLKICDINDFNIGTQELFYN